MNLTPAQIEILRTVATASPDKPHFSKDEVNFRSLPSLEQKGFIETEEVNDGGIDFQKNHTKIVLTESGLYQARMRGWLPLDSPEQATKVGDTFGHLEEIERKLYLSCYDPALYYRREIHNMIADRDSLATDEARQRASENMNILADYFSRSSMMTALQRLSKARRRIAELEKELEERNAGT